MPNPAGSPRPRQNRAGRGRENGLLLLLLLLLAACAHPSGAGGGLEDRARPPGGSPSARAQARAAAERFYAAPSAEAMAEALAEAREAAPDAALTRELAATWTLLVTGDPAAAGVHHAAALRSGGGRARSVEAWRAADPSPAGHRERAAGLEAVAQGRGPPALRAMAADAAARDRFLLGERERAEQLVAPHRRLRWKVLGSFDNDQGKGFDTPLAPESGLAPTGRYDGVVREVQWRDATEAPVGPALDLDAMMSPATWALAYAVSAFAVETATTVSLRVRSSTPFKIWIDGVLAFSARHVEKERFDQFVVPVELTAGTHRVLVKSAQDVGPWRLGVRVATLDGAPAAFRPVAPLTEPEGRARVIGPRTPRAALAAERSRLEAEGLPPLLTRARLLAWAKTRGVGPLALEVSDQLLQGAPDSVLARFLRARTAWSRGQRGEASDLLARLAEAHGRALPRLRLERARALSQEGLRREARRELGRIPREGSVAVALERARARAFAAEGWMEDSCRALERALHAAPGRVGLRMARAACLQQLGFTDQARSEWRAVRRALPGYAPAVEQLRRLALSQGRLDEALAHADARVALLPHRADAQLQRAEILRRLRAFEAAEAAVRIAAALRPDWAGPWRLLGSVRYQAGDRAGAVAAWQEALARDPDEDRLANRLAHLAPTDEGPWTADIPGPQTVRAALDRPYAPRAGAHVLRRLDHEVTLLKPDGSTTDVVTLIATALDDAGRDELTRIRLRRGGRLRIRAAYVVGPDGARTQVSSVRGRVARFRNLSVGSTVVLQYRHDAKPVGYLARHIGRGWWFQSRSAQVLRSEWVLWLPEDEVLNEWVGDPEGVVERRERRQGVMRRVSWAAEDVAPLVAEPNMPTLREVAVNMLVSTVPDWATFLQWEKALLSDAFRSSAQIAALARRITEGAGSPRERLERIHAWLMAEIRYQQDYENHIAGVRPHAAPVVIERGYGDCKDKSVLFITLARELGIEVHFALLRTRPKGPLLRGVPMQQFDHAIVYVPAQSGIERGFFVDSTAEALDLDALRQDDAGAEALVLNPATGEHAWRAIPFRPARENTQQLKAKLRLAPDGEAEGRVTLQARGWMGSRLRRLARNPQAMGQAMQALSARLFSGSAVRRAEAEEVTRLDRPARLGVELEIPALGRREGRQLRLRLPPAWSPKTAFQLKDRRHPLVMGVPRTYRFSTEVELTAGLGVQRLPSAVEVETACFEYARVARIRPVAVRVEERFTWRCERVDTEAYSAHRAAAERILEAQQEELVLRRRSAPTRRAPPAARAPTPPALGDPDPASPRRPGSR